MGVPRAITGDELHPIKGAKIFGIERDNDERCGKQIPILIAFGNFREMIRGGCGTRTILTTGSAANGAGGRTEGVEMNRRFLAYPSGLAVGLLMAGSTNAAVVYNNDTINYIGNNASLQTVGFAGGAASYVINGLTPLAIYYGSVPTTNPGLLISFYTGVNESASSASAVNVLTGATLLGTEAYTLPDTGVTAGHVYNFGLGSASSSLGIVDPVNTVSIEVQLYTDSTFTTLSTALDDVYSTSGPTVGTNTGYTYIDSNGDGMFESNERFTSSATAPLNIALSVDATAVPEPTIAATALLGLTALSRRRCRAC
jgi:hypothetical protein